MTKATIAKLAGLIFFAFIVCLLEFFSSEVLQVQFLCSPLDPCDPKSGGDHHYDTQFYETYGNTDIKMPPCEAKNLTNQDEAVKEWFACETQADLQSLCDNASVSEMDKEVTVILQVTAPPLLQNVTVNGNFSHSGLHIETQHSITLFGCNLQKNRTRENKDETPRSDSSKQNSLSHKLDSSEPGISSAGSYEISSDGTQSRRSHCLFHFKDIRRVSSKSAKWWSVSTIVWLVLVLMVMIFVLLGVRDRVFKDRYHCQRTVMPVVSPVNHPKMFYKSRIESLSDLPDDVPALAIEGHVSSHQRRISLACTNKFFQAFQESYRKALSPIPEFSLTDVSLGGNNEDCDEEVQSDGLLMEEECEMCLDIPLTPASTHSENFTFLHHRSHPSLESCH